MSFTEIEQRCNVLRQDLKVWEAHFAAQNKGRKAGRGDIKANDEISQKYKEYNKLRGKLTAQSAPQTPSKQATNRRSTRDAERTHKEAPEASTSTPLKRKREEGILAEVTPQSPEFLSPQGPSFIGPTPQRNGIVLGLFDHLPAGTPSKRRAVLAHVEINVLQTPSRKTQEAASETSLESRARGDRTPLSAGKRFLFNQFVTPKKLTLDEEGTPSSRQRDFATPSFLRRNNVLSAIDEADEATPRAAPWKRRGLGRSLSAMMQAMRKDEDDRLDEEADIMREMEMEEQGVSVPRKVTIPDMQVEDSQAPMPLGPDRGLESEEDEDEEPELGRDGKPRKAWKKKGLKRQTKRVIMRPNFTKPKPEPSRQLQDSDNGEQVVPETQGPPNVPADDMDSDSDSDVSDYASDASHTPKKRKLQKKAKEPKEGPKDGTVKTAARKIKATAHANYRRLKIKSSTGAKGGAAKGKFGRRR